MIFNFQVQGFTNKRTNFQQFQGLKINKKISRTSQDFPGSIGILNMVQTDEFDSSLYTFVISQNTNVYSPANKAVD